MNILYQGFFLDRDSLNLLIEKSQERLLSKLVENPHITFEFKPVNELPERILGTRQVFVVDGIGSDYDNQGFRIKEIPSSLMRYYHGAEIPHVTVSLSEKGKAVNTKDLDFQDLSPFMITGYMGIYLANHKIVF